MRLRTLPVSVAGVLAGCAYARLDDAFVWWVAVVCLLFAVLAQIASNFANEYFDYRAGIDQPGRDGPRRGVTEGDITPHAMLRATLLTLGVACLLGCTLMLRGGWWLLGAGAVIAFGALAYSTGPFPLSRHYLGEVAVILFFGVVPVCLTYYCMTLRFTMPVFLGSLAVGLMGANVILVNNYRDIESDFRSGKHTLSTLIGRKGSAVLYFAMALTAAVLMGYTGWKWAAIVAVGVSAEVAHTMWTWRDRITGAQCTRLLALSALDLLFVTCCFVVIAFFRHDG